MGERPRAYEHFCLYRDLGPERSLRKVAEGGKGTAKVRRLEKWSVRWRWVDRAQAYDDELDRELRAKNEKARKEMAERHARLAVVGQNILIQQLNAWSQSPPQLTPTEAVRWLDVLVKIERLARGEPTEIGKPEQPGSVGVNPDYDKMSDEELREDAISALVNSGLSRKNAVLIVDHMSGANSDEQRIASQDSPPDTTGC